MGIALVIFGMLLIIRGFLAFLGGVYNLLKSLLIRFASEEYVDKEFEKTMHDHSVEYQEFEKELHEILED